MGLFETMMGHAREFSQAAGVSGEEVRRASRTSPVEDGLRAQLSEKADAGNEPLRLALLFSGDVQGVGFRWTNQSLAQERHLAGWVKNLPDGTVRMEIQGTPRALLAHLERIHAYYARFRNRIWLESATPLDLIPGEDGFDVKF